MLFLHRMNFSPPKKVPSKAQKEERRKIWKICGYEFLASLEKFHKYTALHEDCVVSLTRSVKKIEFLAIVQKNRFPIYT